MRRYHRKICVEIFNEFLKKTGLKGGVTSSRQIIPADYEVVGSVLADDFIIYFRDRDRNMDVTTCLRFSENSIIVESTHSDDKDFLFADPEMFSKTANSVIENMIRTIKRRSDNIQEEIKNLQDRKERIDAMGVRLSGK
jgi:hypothetical protein